MLEAKLMLLGCLRCTPSLNYDIGHMSWWATTAIGAHSSASVVTWALRHGISCTNADMVQVLKIKAHTLPLRNASDARHRRVINICWSMVMAFLDLSLLDVCSLCCFTLCSYLTPFIVQDRPTSRGNYIFIFVAKINSSWDHRTLLV